LAQTGFKEFHEYLKNPGSLKFSGDVHEVLERPMRQEIQKILRRHERGLAELASIGSTAPFIGLFGTVWGIMGALQTISASGQASIDIVAGPIGEALIATAIGIAAALPAVLFYNYFLRKMRIWVTELDGFTEAFLRLASKQNIK
jgi:biopolymer transport protein ExbB